MSSIVKFCADCLLDEGYSLEDVEELIETSSSCYKCGKPVGIAHFTKCYIIWNEEGHDGLFVDISPD